MVNLQRENGHLNSKLLRSREAKAVTRQVWKRCMHAQYMLACANRSKKKKMRKVNVHSINLVVTHPAPP